MGENMSASIQGMIESIATGILEEISAAGKYPEEWDLDLLQQRMNEAFFLQAPLDKEKILKMEKQEVEAYPFLCCFNTLGNHFIFNGHIVIHADFIH